MFFIYLFFAIGVVSVLSGLVPSVIEVYAYVRAHILTFKKSCEVKLENRKTKIEAKRLKKAEEKTAEVKEEEVPVEEKEEEIEEVKEVDETKTDEPINTVDFDGCTEETVLTGGVSEEEVKDITKDILNNI